MNKYLCKFFITENNTMGATFSLELQNEGYSCQYQQFGAEENYNSLSNYISVGRMMMDKELVHLKNPRMKGQFIGWKPDDKSGKTKLTTDPKKPHHGDLVDCYLHFCWKVGNGQDYLRSGTIKKRTARVRTV